MIESRLELGDTPWLNLWSALSKASVKKSIPKLLSGVFETILWSDATRQPLSWLYVSADGVVRERISEILHRESSSKKMSLTDHMLQVLKEEYDFETSSGHYIFKAHFSDASWGWYDLKGLRRLIYPENETSDVEQSAGVEQQLLLCTNDLQKTEQIRNRYKSIKIVFPKGDEGRGSIEKAFSDEVAVTKSKTAHHQLPRPMLVGVQLIPSTIVNQSINRNRYLAGLNGTVHLPDEILTAVAVPVKLHVCVSRNCDKQRDNYQFDQPEIFVDRKCPPSLRFALLKSAQQIVLQLERINHSKIFKLNLDYGICPISGRAFLMGASQLHTFETATRDGLMEGSISQSALDLLEESRSRRKELARQREEKICEQNYSILSHVKALSDQVLAQQYNDTVEELRVLLDDNPNMFASIDNIDGAVNSFALALLTLNNNSKQHKHNLTDVAKFPISLESVIDLLLNEKEDRERTEEEPQDDYSAHKRSFGERAHTSPRKSKMFEDLKEMYSLDLMDTNDSHIRDLPLALKSLVTTSLPLQMRLLPQSVLHQEIDIHRPESATKGTPKTNTYSHSSTITTSFYPSRSRGHKITTNGTRTKCGDSSMLLSVESDLEEQSSLLCGQQSITEENIFDKKDVIFDWVKTELEVEEHLEAIVELTQDDKLSEHVHNYFERTRRQCDDSSPFNMSRLNTQVTSNNNDELTRARIRHAARTETRKFVEEAKKVGQEMIESRTQKDVFNGKLKQDQAIVEADKEKRFLSHSPTLGLNKGGFSGARVMLRAPRSVVEDLANATLKPYKRSDHQLTMCSTHTTTKRHARSPCSKVSQHSSNSDVTYCQPRLLSTKGTRSAIIIPSATVVAASALPPIAVRMPRANSVNALSNQSTKVLNSSTTSLNTEKNIEKVIGWHGTHTEKQCHAFINLCDDMHTKRRLNAIDRSELGPVFKRPTFCDDYKLMHFAEQLKGLARARLAQLNVNDASTTQNHSQEKDATTKNIFSGKNQNFIMDESLSLEIVDPTPTSVEYDNFEKHDRCKGNSYVRNGSLYAKSSPEHTKTRLSLLSMTTQLIGKPPSQSWNFKSSFYNLSKALVTCAGDFCSTKIGTPHSLVPWQVSLDPELEVAKEKLNSQELHKCLSDMHIALHEDGHLYQHGANDFNQKRKVNSLLQHLTKGGQPNYRTTTIPKKSAKKSSATSTFGGEVPLDWVYRVRCLPNIVAYLGSPNVQYFVDSNDDWTVLTLYKWLTVDRRVIPPNHEKRQYGQSCAVCTNCFQIYCQMRAVLQICEDSQKVAKAVHSLLSNIDNQFQNKMEHMEAQIQQNRISRLVHSPQLSNVQKDLHVQQDPHKVVNTHTYTQAN